MPTANDIISSSLRLINVLASGETASAAEASDSLGTLNDMLDSWNAERLLIFTINRLGPYNLTSGKQSYTVGTGGDFNTPRPPRIERVGIISLANPAQPLELPMEYLTDAQWAAIPVKNIQSALPLKVWDDEGYPLRTLSFWCIPNTPVQTVLYAWSSLSQFPDLVTPLTFPPGYARAIRYNLAVDLAPEYGRQVDPAVAAIAMQAKAIVKSQNIPWTDLRCDPALVAPGMALYNWLSDTGVRTGTT